MRKAVPTLTWMGMTEKPLCLMFAPSQSVGDDFATSLIASDPTLTPKQKVEAFLTHVLLHEIGHTLGLRHNFAGSLVPPSSSVMDYLDNDTSIKLTNPGSYDTDAIQLLYGLTQTTPAEPFCTDEDTLADPHCNRFDYPGDPMTVTYIPLYQGFLNQFLTGQTPNAPNNSLNNVLKFVRSGARDEIVPAWNAAIAGTAVPLSSAQLQTPGYAPRADYMARRVLSRLFLDPAQLRGDFAGDPTPSNPRSRPSSARWWAFCRTPTERARSPRAVRWWTSSLISRSPPRTTRSCSRGRRSPPSAPASPAPRPS